MIAGIWKSEFETRRRERCVADGRKGRVGGGRPSATRSRRCVATAKGRQQFGIRNFRPPTISTQRREAHPKEKPQIDADGHRPGCRIQGLPASSWAVSQRAPREEPPLTLFARRILPN